MKILVVDDSFLYLSMVETYLHEIPQISEVILCGRSEEVLEVTASKEVDIIIMDIIMPGITGYDLLKILRSDNKFDDVPIIMFTSLNDLDSYKKCYELGASDFINKPINVIEFQSRLKVAIQSKTSSNNYKKLLEISRKQNFELMEMNAKLKDTQFHLVQSEKMAAIGNLVAGIAHEINNPMGFVSSNFEILQKYFSRLREFITYIKSCYDNTSLENKLPEEVLIDEIRQLYKKLKIELILDELDGVISDSHNGVQRITAIIQSLRVFARSVQDDEKDTYNLNDILRQVMLISNNEIKYVAEVKTSIPEDFILYCNKVQIGQVFINILVNAAQAIKSQNRTDMGSITVVAEKDNNQLAVHFIDDGPGIPQEYLIKIFDPFFTTKEIGEGTGLGLSISYDIIVNKHNGTIKINSEVGKGTEFIVTLPINTSSKEDPFNV